ncbi:MAG: hypothetical protein KBT39_02965 [Bacteroidales bacterium]|nr:hypothetical protein [Bacteroidales bacterium]
MKKLMILSAAGLMLAACANESLVDNSVGQNGKEGPISFVMAQKNMTRAYTDMQKTGHYNFGVFAYKSTDMVNPVMPNYLVGYYDETNAYQKSGTTWGDAGGQEDGLSYWMYEGMGNTEYNGTYAGGALTNAFKSNNENQYLKYWDNAAEYTYFYAYAPYINSAVKPTATYVDGTAQSATGDDTYVLTIPNGSLKDGYDDASLAEYMYASAKVAKANYGHDVALQFKRLNAKVNIKFWEDVPGYSVRVLDLKEGTYAGVQAAASIKDNTSNKYGYKGGKYYTANGVKIKFDNTGADITSTMKQFAGTLAEPATDGANNTTTINFKSPSEAKIGENRYEAVQSPTTYYAIPKGDGANVLADGNTDYATDQACDADLALTGFTFHVSYELTAEDTGEKIVVKNATVHVPYDYCNWLPNTHYTYIFKITKNSNGTTESTPTIDPTDPEVPTTPALYPIVFDNCTVVDWDENESEWEITEGTVRNYHNITLTEGVNDMYSFKSDVEHVLTVGITDGDTHKDHAIDWTSGVTVTGPQTTTGWYNASAKTITVPAGAANGLYTVTYTCPAGDINKNHPATWTQTFFVGNDYAVALNLYKVGTKALAGTKLDITITKDGAAAPTPTADQLYIEYPNHVTPTNKVVVDIATMKVTIAQDAEPGVYKIVYKIKEGDKQVKVDEKTFEVINWQHALSQKVVFLNNGGTVGVTMPGIDDVVYMDAGVASYFTVGAKTSGKCDITVNNDTPEGTYTVNYVTNRTSASSINTYQAFFVVRNTHSVAVSKAAIDRNVGTSTPGAYTTDNIVVTTLFNGAATTADLATAGKLTVVKGDKTATDAGDFTITQTAADANTYNLKVKNNVAPGDYYVKYVSTVAGADKAEYVHFVVTE